MYITSIATGSKAGQAGIKVGDRITGIDGQAIETYMDIKLAMLDRSPGQTLSVKLYREGLFSIAHRNFEVEVTLMGGPGH